MMKKILYIAVSAVMAVSLYGCSSAQNNNTKPNDNRVEHGAEDDDYVQVIKEYMPVDEKYRLYNGYAEAGFEVKFDKMSEKDGTFIYEYEGAMSDERGSDEGKRTFKVSYSVDEDSVVEHVVNNDYMAESSDNIYSIIPDFIVLKGEIKVDNSWEQTLTVDSKEYNGKTTIINISDNSFTTKTEIPMAGYKNGVYTEERTYAKGEGLTSFNNTPYGSDEDDMLIFGYGFSTANESSITGQI